MSSKLRLFTPVALIALALWASPISVAQVYRWVDENGKVHYSDKKPSGDDKQQVELVDEAELGANTNVLESVDDGVDANELQKQRVQRENEREEREDQRLSEQAKAFAASYCATVTENIRQGKAGGGTRIVGSEEVKRCNKPIPEQLQPYLPGYTFSGSSAYNN